MQTCSVGELRTDPVRWGHAVESAVGAQLMSLVRRNGIRYPQAKPYLVGGQGMPLETAFAVSASDLL